MTTNHDIRVGFYVCHCGHNIAGTIDVASIAEYAAKLPHVIASREYKYMCSDPGQELVKKRITEKNFDGVVVSACSPTLHENTFRIAVRQVGMNPYNMEMANIREQCSWVHDRGATEKATSLVRAGVARAKTLQPLKEKVTKINMDVLVI